MTYNFAKQSARPTAQGVPDRLISERDTAEILGLSEYRLTAFRCDETGEAATKEFQRWVPADSSDGLTHETVRYHQRTTPPPKSASRSHPRDRQPENIDSHGLMGETLLDLPEGACTEESRRQPDHAARSTGYHESCNALL